MGCLGLLWRGCWGPTSIHMKASYRSKGQSISIDCTVASACRRASCVLRCSRPVDDGATARCFATVAPVSRTAITVLCIRSKAFIDVLRIVARWNQYVDVADTRRRIVSTSNSSRHLIAARNAGKAMVAWGGGPQTRGRCGQGTARRLFGGILRVPGTGDRSGLTARKVSLVTVLFCVR